MADQFERFQRADHEVRPPIWANRTFFVAVSLVVIIAWASIQLFDLISAPPVTVIGESIAVEGFTYTVTKVESSKVIGTAPLAQTADGVFKTVHLAVLNTDRDSRGIDQNLFTIIDAQGNEYFPVCREDLGDCVNVPQTFTLSTLRSGEETIGILVFDVDAEATGFQLRIIIEPVTGKSVYFKLD